MQIGEMLRMAFFVLALMLPVALLCAAGVWTLLAVPAAVAILFVFSSRPASGVEVHQGGRLTGYRTTEFGKL